MNAPPPPPPQDPHRHVKRDDKSVSLDEKTVTLQELRDKTDDQIEDETLEIAISTNKTHELVKTHRKVLRENDHLDPFDAHDIQFALSQQEGDAIKWHTLKHNQGSFCSQPVFVKIGNCPSCFRAMPIGRPCPQCNRKSCLVHFANDINIMADDDEIREEIYQKGHQKVDPIELSCQLLGLTPLIDVSHQKFKQTCDMSFDGPHVSDVVDLMRQIKANNRTEAVTPNCMVAIEKATCVPLNEISVDVHLLHQCNPGFFTPEEWQQIDTQHKILQVTEQEEATDRDVASGHLNQVPGDPDPDLFY